MGKWLKDKPSDKDSFSVTPAIVQDNLDAIEDIFGKEHSTLGDTLCGAHVPGIMGAMASASTFTISLITTPGSGAIAFDTSVGWIKRRWGGTWAIPGSGTKWSRARAYLGTNQPLPANTPTQINFASESYDSLEEFSAYTFTASAEGHYLVVASWCASGENVAGADSTIGIILLKNDILELSAARAVHEPGTETDVTIKISEVVALQAGGTIKIQAYKTTNADTIVAGSDRTFIAVHRLGSQMM